MEQRKILFKAKHMGNGKWVKGSLLESPLGTQIVWWKDDIEYRQYVDPSTVCQFTGLKDDNEIPIYEHDIIQDFLKKVTRVVNWNAFECRFFAYGDKECLGTLKAKGWTVVCSEFDRKEEK